MSRSKADTAAPLAAPLAAPVAPRFALAWAALTYAVAALTLGYPALAGQFLVNTASDQYIAGYAFREFAANALRSTGGFPLWNPYLFGGMPYVAAMHGDIFYPTFLLRMLLPTDVAMTWSFILHIFLAGLFTYLFLRAWRFGFAAAIAGGLAYMMGGPIAAYVSPGDGFTTWALNTRNSAVSEYQNYKFNSFARIGNHYLGANESGVYDLTGDTDNGASIIANLKSGLAQLGGFKFSSFSAAYVGMRGTGNFILRLITGDGVTYDYALVPRNMKTTKINLGKGLRARFFAFQLISSGSNFDLEGVELIPLVAQRRV